MTSSIDPGTSVGTVALSVADLERSLAYYQQHIGLAVLEQHNGGATLGVAGAPLLQLQEVPGARLVRRATGLYHFALRVPSRHDLARVIRHFADASTPIDGASDHLVSEALYLADPDGHGIEVYRDRPRDAWVDRAGRFRMDTIRLDVAGILGELQDDEPDWAGLTEGTDMGHVHLQVADIAATEKFYIGVLGMERMTTYPGASFVSAGGYHHHLGLNIWAGAGVPPPPEHAARLLSYELRVPSAAGFAAVLDRVRAAGLALTEQEHGWAVRDPAQNTVVLRQF